MSATIEETLRARRGSVLFILLLLGLSAFLHVLLAASGSKDWLLFAARMGLEGRPLYTGVVEVNPPLILWMYTLPVWISQKISSVSDGEALGLMGLCMSMFFASLGGRLIRYHAAFEQPASLPNFFGFILLMLFVFFTATAVFADRDHILFMATLPYILRFMPGLAGRSIPLGLRFMVGAGAALGFCIKPHAFLILAAVQLLALREKRARAVIFSVENGIIALGAALYAAAICQFAPEYLHTILPMAFETYSSYRSSGTSLVYLPLALFSAGLTFADFRRGKETPYRRDIAYFVGISAAFLVYAVLGNGWEYTYHPLLCMLLFLSGWVLLEYRWLMREQASGQEAARRDSLLGIRACKVNIGTQFTYHTLCLISSCFIAHYVATHCEGYMECKESKPFVQYLQDRQSHSFGTITTDFPKWVTVARLTHLPWETRFNALWMIPALVERDEEFRTQHAWILTYVAQAYADDLNVRKPDVIFVDSGRQYYSFVPVDLLALLSGNNAFRDAISHYRRSAVLDECGDPDVALAQTSRLYCRYDVYTRVDSP